eukprot:jgi/Orpsp1_1/1186896/evm.model.d7180000053945.1
MEPFRNFLISNQDIDANIADSDGMTAALYLTEKGYFDEFCELHKKKFNFDYKYRIQNLLKIMLELLNALVIHQYDFNFPIDNDDTTPFMMKLIVNDIQSAKFCAKCLKKLDLSMKNKYGENATSLCYKLNRHEILNSKYFKKKKKYYVELQSPIDYAHDIEEEDQRELFLNLLQNPSYNLNNRKFNNSVSTKYEEEIHNYLIPCTNNNYPEFKLTPEIKDIEEETYNQYGGSNMKDRIKLIIFVILMFVIVGVTVPAVLT